MASNSDTPHHPQTEGGKCVELALEGEKRCRGGDTKGGISFLEAALAAGTDDLRTLSAIYSQLGNAYFYLSDYLKALEYHRHDLTLARTIGDRLGEAKASGNLGNTHKVLGKFEEAILCCRRHLEISQEQRDKIGEGRAYYNLGNVYHAKGKHIGRLMCNTSDTEATEFPQEVKISLLSAVDFYEANLRVVQDLGDRAAQGRACGNLGNTHYLLGQFDRAVDYHNQRLNIAKEFGDKPAMRRAYSNLGNAHVFLGEFEMAADYYRKALAIALELGDKATEAQACYSLGNTATLMGEHEQAVDYHLRHLRIARQLDDRVGQARAAWSLGNAYTALQEHPKALYFVMVHLHLSKEIGDTNGGTVAQGNLAELGEILGPKTNPDDSADPDPFPIDLLVKESGMGDKSAALDRVRRRSMDHVELWRLTPDRNTPEDVFDEESFFDLLTKVQGKRINDQRCDASTLDNKENRPRVRATDGFRQSSADTSPASSTQSKKSRLSISSLFRRESWSRASTHSKMSLRIPKFLSVPSLSARGRWSFSSWNRQREPSVVVESTPAKGRRTDVPSLAEAEDLSSIFDSREDLGRSLEVSGLPAPDQTPEEFLEMITMYQSRRMDDQRASLPFLPGLQDPARVLGPHLEKKKAQENGEATKDAPASGLNAAVAGTPAAKQASGGVAGKKPLSKSKSSDVSMVNRREEDTAQSSETDPARKVTDLDEDFYEMLIKCQSTRIEEQRSELPRAPPVKPAPTVPDEDFFQLIMRLQARRFDEQRAALSPAGMKNSASAPLASGPGRGQEKGDTQPPPEPQKPPKRTASQKIKKR